MNQETRNLIDFIKNKEANLERLGTVQYNQCLLSLAAAVEKQEMYEGFEIFCNNLKELFDEEDIKELVEALQSYNYFIVYSVLYKLLRNYLTSGDVRSWLSVIQTNDPKSQYLVMDYLSMRFHIQKENKDDN